VCVREREYLKYFKHVSLILSFSLYVLYISCSLFHSLSLLFSLSISPTHTRTHTLSLTRISQRAAHKPLPSVLQVFLSLSLSLPLYTPISLLLSLSPSPVVSCSLARSLTHPHSLSLSRKSQRLLLYSPNISKCSTHFVLITYRARLERDALIHEVTQQITHALEHLDVQHPDLFLPSVLGLQYLLQYCCTWSTRITAAL